jgi:universal stress protein A
MAFTHILAPTDFSDSAQHALRYAFEEAAHHQAQLTLLHVMQHPYSTNVHYIKGAPEDQIHFEVESGGTLPRPESSPPQTVLRDYGEEALTQLRDLLPDSLSSPGHAQVATGDPADAIVRVAQEISADLIIMGTHGRTGLSHILLGSAAEKVVRHAPCPVLIVRYNKQTATTDS